jgi:DNA-binding MarR family transcriptional regulator
MAGKFSRWLRTERSPQRDASLRLSPLQQSILHWLRNELRRRQRVGDAGMVPYPDLVRALRADKASITSEVRHLLRKGLLSVTLPAGEWVRYVMLTEQGDTYAQTLSGHVQHVRRRG